MNNPLDDAARSPLLRLLASAEDANEALANLLAEETRLLRAGAMKDALALAPQKATLSLAHARAGQNLRHHAVALHRHARAETLAFRERERALLKAAEINVRLLATLRTALDSIMRQALNTKDGPASPYARSGTIAPQNQTGHRLLSVQS
jgi:hypothetical protein